VVTAKELTVNEILGLAEAGMRLGVSPWVVRNRLCKGELDGGRDRSGRFYVTRASVEAFAKARSGEQAVA
jgi:hypothetical protein